MNLVLRRATSDDVPALETLIAESARGLGQRDYSPTQIEAAIGTAWAVDHHLVQDGSLWLARCQANLSGAVDGVDAAPWRVPARRSAKPTCSVQATTLPGFGASLFIPGGLDVESERHY